MGASNASREPIITQHEEIVSASFRDIGQTLAEARIEQGLTIKQVASKIHIRQRYLIDLEEGNLSDLPGRVYILGFIRTYARLLNLDGEELVRRINRLPNVPDYDRSHIPLPMNVEDGPSASVLIISGVVLFFVALGGYFFLKPSPTQPVEEDIVGEQIQPHTEKHETTLPVSLPLPVPQELKIVENKPELKPNGEKPKESLLVEKKSGVVKSEPKLIYPKDMPVVLPDPQSTKTEGNAKTTPFSKTVTLKATEPSWVEVRDETGRVIFMKVMRSGEEYTVPEKPGVTVSTGNSGGIDIFVGEKKLPSLGVRGVVKRGIRVEALISAPS